ncbi:unnamed protein product, partial [marine sediment metagenome]
MLSAVRYLLNAINYEGKIKMITVLRRRIDPANIQNLLWRPQGGTRFEIQMPLASEETHEKRRNFEEALTELLAKNINPAIIMRSLLKPPEERTEDFNDFATGSSDRQKILADLATAYDELNDLQNKRNELFSKLQMTEDEISAAELDLEQIKLNISNWSRLDDQQLTESLKDFLGSDKGTPNAEKSVWEPDNLDLLTGYVNMYAQWAEVVEQLTEPETGKNDQYKNAKKALDKLNLTEDQVNFCLEMSPKSLKRSQTIDELKIEFADRSEEIDNVVAAFDEYRPFRGRLDDPKDLQRMLKGAGILEFRILPTLGHPEVDSDEMAGYVELLRTKGPKYASDIKYVWCEVESIEEWIGVG